MAPKVKGVIFDMYGLMFDTERIWDTFWVPCCRKLGLPDPPQAFYSGGRGLAGDGLRAHIAEFYGSAAGELLEEINGIREILAANPQRALVHLA